MITQKVTKKKIEEWKNIWLIYKDKLQPNRKSGTELLSFLQEKYVLSEIQDEKTQDIVTKNITLNSVFAEKLPLNTIPIQRTFYVENEGNGEILYRESKMDSAKIFGEVIPKIFVGLDIVTGYFIVEGSTFLWDEMMAYRGLDEKDIQNYVCVSQYVEALKKFN